MRGPARIPHLAIAALALAAIAAPACRGGTSAADAPGEQTPAVPVVVTRARHGDLPVYLRGLGTVTAYNTVTMRSRIDGALQKVAFTEGHLVAAGDLLAQIDPRPYQVQLEQAEGQMARDQASLANARLDLDRLQALFDQGTIARQQLDSAIAAAGQSEGAVKVDQAMIDNARLQLVYCRITAPIAGRVGLRLVDAGNMVRANDPNGLLVITQIEPIAVVFTIPEDALPALLRRLRDGAELPVEAYDRDGSMKIATGRLLTVDNQIDPATGTSKLKAVFDNRDGALFPNQFVNVKLRLDVDAGAVIVPVVSVQRGPKGAFVYVVGAGKLAEVRPVTLGPMSGADVVIRSGVAEGDAVVVDGMDKLRAGSPVREAASTERGANG